MPRSVHLSEVEPVATEGTIKQFYRGLNYVVVKTMDGVEHVYNFTKDLSFTAERNQASMPSRDCARNDRGRPLFIERCERVGQEIDVLGDEGLSFTEGVVSRIDRGRRKSPSSLPTAGPRRSR
jgi:hypothetical protein